MPTPKKTSLIFEMNGEKYSVKQIEDLVKSAKGTKTAYVNCAEAAVYCVDGDGKTTKVPLAAE